MGFVCPPAGKTKESAFGALFGGLSVAVFTVMPAPVVLFFQVVE